MDGQPIQSLQIKSLGTTVKLLDVPIAKIKLLGSNEKIQWLQTEQSLNIEAPKNQPCDYAVVFKITTK